MIPNNTNDTSSAATPLAAPQIADCGASAEASMPVGTACGWVSVNDSLPEENAEVVAIGPAYGDWSKGRFASLCTFAKGTFYSEDGDDIYPPSHWQNMPPAAVVSPADEAHS